MSRTTDKYIKIRKEADKAPENEIRIRADARIGRYISYAATLLLERKLDTVILKASGVATRSAVQIAEILRHRILNLHQLTQLKTITVLDEYEPREEGLDRVSIERHLAVLEITLSMKDGVLDTKQAGYQAPLPKEEVQEEDLKSLTERRRPARGGDREGGDDRRQGGRGGRGYGGRGGRGFGGRGGRGSSRGRGGRGFGGRRDDDREGGRREYDREGGRRDYEGGRRDYEGGRREGGRRDYEGGRSNYEGGRREYDREGGRDYEGGRREGGRPRGFGGRGRGYGARGGRGGNYGGDRDRGYNAPRGGRRD